MSVTTPVGALVLLAEDDWQRRAAAHAERVRPWVEDRLARRSAGHPHAVWDFLHRLGYRQFFPGETWEVVPSAPDLGLAVDARERPSFHARRIWYNWAFGVTTTSPTPTGARATAWLRGST